MLIIPFMSCSARLPVYVLLISAFFPKNQGLVLLSVYLFGILIAILSSILFKRVFFRRDEAPFVMELPPYRIPTTAASCATCGVRACNTCARWEQLFWSLR